MSLVSKVKDTTKLAMLPRVPVSDQGTTTPKTIVFSQAYFGVALDLMIENKDVTNPLLITVNKQVQYSLAGGANKKFDNMIVDILELIPNTTTGSWFLDAGLVDYWLFRKVAINQWDLI